MTQNLNKIIDKILKQSEIPMTINSNGTGYMTLDEQMNKDLISDGLLIYFNPKIKDIDFNTSIKHFKYAKLLNIPKSKPVIQGYVRKSDSELIIPERFVKANLFELTTDNGIIFANIYNTAPQSMIMSRKLWLEYETQKNSNKNHPRYA